MGSLVCKTDGRRLVGQCKMGMYAERRVGAQGYRAGDLQQEKVDGRRQRHEVGGIEGWRDPWGRRKTQVHRQVRRQQARTLDCPANPVCTWSRVPFLMFSHRGRSLQGKMWGRKPWKKTKETLKKPKHPKKGAPALSAGTSESGV